MTRESLDRWGVALLFGLLIAGYPLISSLSPLLGIGSRFFSVPYRAFVLVIALGILIWTGLNRGRLYRGLFWLPLSLFWSLYFLRLLLDTAVFPVETRLASWEYWMFAIGVSFIPMMAFLVRPNDAGLDRALVLTIVMTGIAVIVGLYTNIRAVLAGDTQSIEAGRISTDTLNPISFGHLGASLVILSATMLLSRRTTSLVGKLVCWGLVFLGLGVTVLSSSRGPLLALVAGLAILFVATFRRGNRLGMLAGSIVILGAGSFGGMAIQERVGFGVFSRIQKITSTFDNASDLRMQYMHDAWQQFLDHPVLGSGLEERNSKQYPHNVVVESFMATGVLGGFTFITLLVLSLLAAGRVIFVSPRNGWVAALYLQYLVGAMVSGSLYGNATMWALMGSIIVIASSTTQVMRPLPGAGLSPQHP